MKRKFLEPDTPKILKAEFQALLHNKDNEEVFIKLSNEFISAYGKEMFLKLCQNPILVMQLKSQKDVTYQIKLLHYAVSKNYINIARFLVELGVDVNAVLLPTDATITNTISPLTIAINNGNLQLIEYLINQGADLKIIVGEKNILMLNNKPEVFSFVLTKAKELGYLKDLFRLTSEENYISVFSHLLNKERFTLLQMILSLPDWEQFIDPNVASKILHDAIIHALNKPNLYKEYINICLIFRDYFKKSNIPRFAKNTIMQEITTIGANIKKSYNSLLGHQFNPTTLIDNEENKLLHIMAQAHNLLNNPHRCIKYLYFLNNAFYRFLMQTYGKDIVTVDPSHYSFMEINNIYYPIPNYDFVGQHKNNALDKFLIALFNQYGLAKIVNHWVGFVPHEIANKTVTDGNYIKENIFSPNGLLHNSLAHMLQQAILIYAIQNGEINTHYQDKNGETKTINIQQILKKFVEKNPHKDYSFWETVRDTRHEKTLRFIDPFNFVATIMYEGHKYQLHSLRNSLIDSFCKNFLKLYEARLSNAPQLKINRYQFVQELNDLEINLFVLPDYLRDYALDYAKRKGKIDQDATIHDPLEGFAVLAKNYSIDNPNYVPESYRDENQGKIDPVVIAALRLINKTIKDEFSPCLDYAFDSHNLILQMMHFEGAQSNNSGNSNNFKLDLMLAYSINEMSLVDGSLKVDSLLLILIALLKNSTKIKLFHELMVKLNKLHDDVINLAELLASYDGEKSLKFNICKYHLSVNFDNDNANITSVSTLMKILNDHPSYLVCVNNTIALSNGESYILVKDIKTADDLESALSICAVAENHKPKLG